MKARTTILLFMGLTMIFSISFFEITDSKADDGPKDGIYSTATGRCWGNGTDCKKKGGDVE